VKPPAKASTPKKLERLRVLQVMAQLAVSLLVSGWPPALAPALPTAIQKSCR